MPVEQKKITMQALAQLAEVDVSTVSRALNNSPLVKDDTKAHILKIARETGYVVNASARNLRRQSSDTIGIVIPLRPASGQTISDPFFLEMMGAVSHAASMRGYDLIVSLPQTDDSGAEQRLIQTGRADGLIVIGQAGREDRLNALGPILEKVVVWGGQSEQAAYTLVGSDNLLGGTLAGEHLLRLGRRRILFLGERALPEVGLRFAGMMRAHQTAGVARDDVLNLDLNFGGQGTFQAVTALVEAGTRFDAVFAASDVLAIAAIHALHARGLNVPEDVAVVGYDNIGQAPMATPPLTTIDQHIALGGEMMVDMLLQKIAGETPASILTPTTLIVRQSCGAKP